MKKYLILSVSLLLTACGSTAPNLVHTHSPILNITQELAPLIEANVSENAAWVKNKTNNPLNIAYDLFWYNQSGVTQLWANQQESQHKVIQLENMQKVAIPLEKPTSDSENYRLYLQRP